MRQSHRVLVCVLLLLLSAGAAFAKKTVFITNNGRFNFVKLQEVSFKVAESRAMNHPADLDPEVLRRALANIRFTRAEIIGAKSSDPREVFGEGALNFLTNNLVEAFRRANSTQEVVFSYLSKEPNFIVRDDRLTIGTCWIHGDKLHIKFNKLYAKLTGDTDKRGGEGQSANRARGVRISLEMGNGQEMSYSDPSELIIALNEVPDAPAPVVAEHTAPAPAKGKAAKAAPAATPVAAATPAAAPASTASPKERLKSLDELKKEGLITQQEYDQKRQAILNSL